MEKFIDVSYHKGYMDFNKVKDAGYTGVVLKATDGFFMPDDMNGTTWKGHTDPSFPLYWNSLNDLFNWRACYHFLRVDDEKAEYAGRLTSYEQIPFFHTVVENEGLEWDDIIILDIEQHPSQIDYLSGEAIATRIQDAIAATEELFERKPVIYTGAWWWEMYHKYFDTDFMYEYPFWLSHYWNISSSNDIVYNGTVYLEKPNRAFPYEWQDDLNKRLAYCRLPMVNNDRNGTPSINPEKVWMWQFTQSGRVSGIGGVLSKPVDVNYYMTPGKWEDWDEARAEPPTLPPDNGCQEKLEYILEVLQDLIAKIKEWLDV